MHDSYNRGAGSGIAHWFRRELRKRPKPLWMVITADVLMICAALLVFALFHHVLPRHQTSLGVVSSRDAASTDRAAIADMSDDTDVGAEEPATDFDLSQMNSDSQTFNEGTDVVETAETDAMADGAEAETGDDGAAADTDEGAVPAVQGEKVGDMLAAVPKDFAEVFPDKFTDGKVIKNSSGYQSANINVSLKRFESDDVVFYVADIYVRDVSYLVTAFAQGRYGKGVRGWTRNIANDIGAIIAINGDYYGGRDDGIVIRNGELYRTDPYPSRDVCVLFWDGTMETYGTSKFNAQAAIDNGAYQAWNFGPRLLDENGKAKTRFNSDVGPSNPRTALGYYEPGHYCFVVVDGRTKSSGGMRLTELAALMEQLGCTRAYNMDGGNTSVMVAGGQIVNNPSGGGRPTTDIIAIVDK